MNWKYTDRTLQRGTHPRVSSVFYPVPEASSDVWDHQPNSKLLSKLYYMLFSLFLLASDGLQPNSDGLHHLLRYLRTIVAPIHGVSALISQDCVETTTNPPWPVTAVTGVTRHGTSGDRHGGGSTCRGFLGHGRTDCTRKRVEFARRARPVSCGEKESKL